MTTPNNQLQPTQKAARQICGVMCERKIMEVTKIIGVDVCRDGGSYSLSFESNDNEWYELFVQVKGIGSNEYLEPAIYRGGANDGQLVQKLSWLNTKEFLKPLKHENKRFQELVKIVENNGKNT